MRLISLSSLIFAAVCAVTPPVAADPSPVVVELYTSQGCSSCPPADELLQRLAQREDVLALAYHVDYWDYIGWRDIFADPAHTDRQRGYAHVGERNMIYTPQMIIMGREDVVGADAMQLAEAMENYLGHKPRAKLSVALDGRTLTVSLPQLPDGGAEDLRVQLVQYMPMRRVDIKRGELAGHSIDYANVVERHQVLADWDGAAPLELSVTLAEDLPAAVLVQEWPYGPILAAARVE
ncbi:DUF1223 domain-containing protein [Epibacterium sp. MM17-32]|uniref:DUF1223 domain-containing protein n=1 Tax=Epibacterium sp. MM17-32 TaxID=2917734 RepID=UPI001EF54F6D|nr:DUF1223 domain-containing protein [Epibacterium sp. MM17-32]MCG7628429.1 DUF1223 domain-containing protein [Epibacterium sp. MM17-32]